MTTDSIRSRWIPCASTPFPLRLILVVSIALFFFNLSPALAADSAPSGLSGNNTLSFGSEDNGTLNFADSSFELNGNAFITSGAGRVTADHIKIYFKKGTGPSESVNADVVEKMTATGNVAIVSEMGIANAGEAVYDSAIQTLVLTGDPATATFHYEKNTFEMECPIITVTNFNFKTKFGAQGASAK